MIHAWLIQHQPCRQTLKMMIGSCGCCCCFCCLCPPYSIVLSSTNRKKTVVGDVGTNSKARGGTCGAHIFYSASHTQQDTINVLGGWWTDGTTSSHAETTGFDGLHVVQLNEHVSYTRTHAYAFRLKSYIIGRSHGSTRIGFVYNALTGSIPSTLERPRKDWLCTNNRDKTR